MAQDTTRTENAPCLQKFPDFMRDDYSSKI